MAYLSPTLAVRDMKKTIDFYKDSLGFKMGMAFPDVSQPEYVDLSKDGMILMFIPTQNLGISDQEKLGIGVNLYMQIDGDIDEYYQELKKKGVSMTVDIKDEQFGIRDFTVEDVDGYQLTFNQLSRTNKNCLSCGMPMAKVEDFAAMNPTSLYCVRCANDDGSLKSYYEVLQGMVQFMMGTQNMGKEAAEVAAKEYMAKMPAWEGKE